MPEPVPLREPEVFEPCGLGWRFRPPDVPAVLTFDRVVERRDEVTAELLVQTREGGYLARRRVPLLGSRSLSDFARDLEEMDGCRGWPWRAVLGAGCESALNAHRAGRPILTTEGELVRPRPATYQCDGLVMAGVVNCWLAAASTGKSTLAKLYCLHHAAGVPFLGRPVERGVPLYLDYEDTHESFNETAYLGARGLGLSRVPRLHWREGGGPLRNQVHQLGRDIDRLGVTLLVIDPVAAAGGPIGERGYEAVAMEVEQALIALPRITVLLLDHITGDELKNGNVPLKARGAVRKYEFIRYQWTISLDREAGQGRHVVGFTHTKVNRGRYREQFGVELLHRDEEARLELRTMAAGEVQPLAERMTLKRRLLAELDDGRHRTPASLSDAVFGTTDRRKVEQVRVELKRHRSTFGQDGLGDWYLMASGVQAAPTPLHPDRSDNGYQDLPF